MSDIDMLILAIGKKKSKIREIKRILADKSNFEWDEEALAYKIKSLTSDNVWRVSLNPSLCNCTYNFRYKKDKSTECIHLLALRTWLNLNIL